MPTLRTSMQIDMDGAIAPGFPLFYRAAPTILVDATYAQPSAPGFVTATTPITTIQQIILQSDQTVLVAFNGVTATPLTLTAGAILAVLGCTVTSLEIENTSGSVANIKGLLAGV